MTTDKPVEPIMAKNEGGGEFELVPAGVYLARCYKMIHVGTQTVEFKGARKKVKQVYIWWEILQDDEGKDVFMSDGERVFSIFKQYTLSMHEKANLRADLDAWRGVPFTDEQAKEFDITKLLDKFCMIQVIHKVSNGKTYANVGSIMTTRKKAEGMNDLIGFSIANPNMELFESFPDWIKDKIRSADEWKVETHDGSINAEGEIEIEDLTGGEPISLANTPF